MPRAAPAPPAQPQRGRAESRDSEQSASTRDRQSDIEEEEEEEEEDAISPAEQAAKQAALYANPFYRGPRPAAAAAPAPERKAPTLAKLDVGDREEKRPAPTPQSQQKQPQQQPVAPARRPPPPDSEEDEASEAEEEEEDESSDDGRDQDEEEEEEEDLGGEEPVTKKYRQPKLRFDLTTFSGTFDAGTFVSELTRDLFSQQDPIDFDPTPFSTLFDSALARLNALRDETDERIREYASQCKRDEETHKENLIGLQEQLGVVLGQFSRLDSRISSVAHTAARIGHTLQTVDAAKRSNVQGQEIISHFLAFNTGDRSKLPAIYLTQDPTELHRAAELIQCLCGISQDLRVKGTEKATELIARTSNDIENQLIARFDLASARQNVEEMKACAVTLLNFRGKSLIKRYVFNVIEKLEGYAQEKEREAKAKYGGGANGGGDAGDDDGDHRPSSSPTHRGRTASVEDIGGFQAALLMAESQDDKTLVGAFRLRLLRFYRGVSLSMREQIVLCAEVFPHPLTIIKALLERVFQDKIQGLVDSALNEKRLGTEEYLRCLEFAHTQTNELVQGLQAALRTGLPTGHHAGSRAAREKHGEEGAAMGLYRQSSMIDAEASAAALNGASSGTYALGSSSASSGSSEQVHMLNLSESVSGIFATYRAEHFQREMHLIGTTCNRLIRETLEMQPERQPSADPKEDTDFLGRLKKTVVQDQKQKWVYLVLEYPLVDKLIQQSTLSLARCDKLSDPSMLAEHASTLFLHVAQSIFESYLQPILDVAFESLPPPEPKTEPDMFFYQVVGLVNLCVDKLWLHWQHWIVTRMVAQPNTQVICETRLRELMGKIESQLAGALAKMLGASLKYTQRLLSTKQKQIDYRPREDDSDAVLDGKPSSACESVVHFVNTQYEAIVTCLDGKNLDKFLTVFGLKLHESVICARPAGRILYLAAANFFCSSSFFLLPVCSLLTSRSTRSRRWVPDCWRAT
jgi:hypothetical protein